MARTGLVISNIEGVTVAHVRVASLLDGTSIDEVSNGLYALVDQQACRKLVVDFSAVSHMASQMLGALVNLNKKAQSIKGRVILCGIRPSIMKVFKITRLNKVLTIVADESAAMHKFGLGLD